ncbi:MAG: cyclodeaminase/cyclohydrolase family protein, partial [Candidatus Thermoplasmatota archaeon]|nr:cyclodeaminase/cyclohydrolase family protein [Candidatus Thermoplasmatota archaeon]
FKPDFGKPIFVPKSGATATGCRSLLLAYNINLNTNDKSIASKISGIIRTSGTIKRDNEGNRVIGPDGKPERFPGKFKGVQAGGMMYDENIAQVSMNLLNYKDVNLHHVFESVKEESEKLGAKVTGSEIVGLVPKESLVLAGKFYSEKENLKIDDEEELVSIAVEKLGLSDLSVFKPEEKIIEYIIQETRPLANMKINGFLSELASSSPAPGGGSVAALSGALGAALSSMVCNLTVGKEKYIDVQDEIQDVLKKSEVLKRELTKLIDEDTNAFSDVIKAFKMPKETEEQKKKRSAAIQKGYKTAASVPLETAKTCEKILNVAQIVAEKGNQSSITDAAVSALMAKAGVESAILNVKINLGSIKDEKFVEKLSFELDELEISTSDKKNAVMKIVENNM